MVVGAARAIGAGLYSIGIPKDSILKYETAIKSDKFIVLAHGTAEEVAKARDILHTMNPAEVTVHSGAGPEVAAA